MALSAEQRARVKKDWPAFYYLLNIPDLERLFERAINEGWGPGEFQSNLMATNWWKSRSKTTRNWDTLVATDPAEAARQRAQRRRDVADEARRLGVKFASWDIALLAEKSLREGWSTAEITHGVVGLGDSKGIAQVGEIRTTAQSLRALGKQYAVAVSASTLTNWAQEIAMGRLTEDNLRARFADMAKQRIDPQGVNLVLRRALDSGLTVRDAYQGVIETVSNELEIDQSQVDLTSGHWGKLLDYEDGKGNQRPMTQTEAVRWARSQGAWQQTQGSRELYAGLSNAMTTKWGLRK
jgi:hypothetical protein